MSLRTVDFIIAGSMRCGTTSLYYELARHPEISMSRKKETDHFISDCPPQSYDAQFNKSKRIWGEASPNYSKFDIFPDVPQRIHKHSPNTKLIFLVRDPCDRIVSQYRHSLAMGNISNSESISIGSKAMTHMINTSKYFAQLSKFREYFDKNSLLVLKMEDYIDNRLATLDKMTNFIGASAHDWGDKPLAENSSHALMRYPNIIKNLRKNVMLQKLYNRIPHQWQTRAKNLVSHKSYSIKENQSAAIYRNELLNILRDDIIAFGNEYKIDVSGWLMGTQDDA